MCKREFREDEKTKKKQQIVMEKRWRSDEKNEKR